MAPPKRGPITIPIWLTVLLISIYHDNSIFEIERTTHKDARECCGEVALANEHEGRGH